MVELSSLLAELPEVTRNSTSGALDNNKRTRAINRTLQDLQDFADYDFTRRTKEFDFIDGISEYSLENFVGATCLDNDGVTAMGDFKNPYDLRVVGLSHIPFANNDLKDVRDRIRRGRSVNEYAIDGDLLVVNYPGQGTLTFHNCDSLTGNGAWAVSGDASNLTLDEVEYKEGSGALNFDVTAGTSLILANSTLAALDLTDYQNVSYLLVEVYLPTVTSFTNIVARWGSSDSAYWTKTETARADGQALRVGWNLFAFKWAGATTSGSPSVSAVDYLRFAITYGASTTATDFRIDNVRFAKRIRMELEYYSLAMAEDDAGNPQLEFNADTIDQNERLRGGVTARNAVIAGAKHDCFEIIGGKSERDRTDSFNKYKVKKMDLLKKCGHRLRRQAKVLNFPSRR